ncbi:MAG: hypothetical protein K1060chlam1_01236 [Candidatus Anoxychlamydiales bacterium]|nr:hypothetical protein [Candidatus Anoxychlamydiales bacterium]
MLGFSSALTRFKSSFSVDNAKALFDWSYKNKNYILPCAIPTVTFVASKALFNSSFKSSLMLTTFSLSATIIDQKYPNIKYEIIKKIKIFSKMIQTQYQKIQKQNNMLSKIKKEADDKTKALLMISFLRLNKNSIESLELLYQICNYFGLDQERILALLNAYNLSPKKNDEDYQKRLEAFIELLPADKKHLFEKFLKKCKKD